MYHCVLQVYRSGTTFLHRHSSWNNSSAIDFYNRRFVSAIHSATSGFCLFEYFTSNFKKQVNTCFTLFIYIHIFYCRGRRAYFKNQQSWCSFFWKISGFSYRISNFHLEFFFKSNFPKYLHRIFNFENALSLCRSYQFNANNCVMKIFTICTFLFSTYSMCFWQTS